MADTIWIRGEKAPRTVTISVEGAAKVVYEEAGKKQEVESWRVRWFKHGDTPPELDEALARVTFGDMKGAEEVLAGLERSSGWLPAHASFHHANARRLRALLEGKGHDEALERLVAWRKQHADHFLAPLAALAAGEAALEAGVAAAGHFEALVKEAGTPWRLLGRWGLARCKALKDIEGALADLEKLEKEALADEWGNEAAQLARVERASILFKQGKHEESAKLLSDVIELEAWVGTPARARALNLLADVCVALGGQEDGKPKPEGLIAASPFWLRVVRHAPLDPIERPRALAGAYRASVAAGMSERAHVFKSELVGRFGGSRWAQGI
jgi:hypothetical protein